MTLEQRLKQLEQNEVELANRCWSLIQALRKAIEQRDYWMHDACEFKHSNEVLDALIKLANENKELLEILGGEK